MALIKRIEIGRRYINVEGHIHVRTDTVVEEDGIELSRTYHSHVVVPGQDYSGEDVSVRRLAAVEHTPDVIAAQQARTRRD